MELAFEDWMFGNQLEYSGNQTVVDPGPLTLSLDNAGGAQKLEVVRYRRLAEVEPLFELTDAELAGFCDHVHHQEAVLVTESFADRRHTSMRGRALGTPPGRCTALSPLGARGECLFCDGLGIHRLEG